MPSPKLEKRITALEEELSTLKNRIDAIDTTIPWWERIAGTFQDDPVYAKAMKLGREYRQSLNTADSSARKKP
jgi:hypothetical protein